MCQNSKASREFHGPYAHLNAATGPKFHKDRLSMVNTWFAFKVSILRIKIIDSEIVYRVQINTPIKVA